MVFPYKMTLVGLQLCEKDYAASASLTHIVLWIQLEELPVLCGLKSIFLQLVFAEGALFKVFLDLGCHNLCKQTLCCDWGQGSSLRAIRYIRFEFKSLQVRHHKFWNHGP